MTVYRTYIEMMNDDIRTAFQIANTFPIRARDALKSAGQFDDVGSCVVMAATLNVAKRHVRDFEAWCSDDRNCVIIAAFAVQGTLARDILGNVSEVVTRSGQKLPLRCQVNTYFLFCACGFPADV